MYSPHKVLPINFINKSLHGPDEDLGGKFSFEENHLKSPHEDLNDFGDGEA